MPTWIPVAASLLALITAIFSAGRAWGKHEQLLARVNAHAVAIDSLKAAGAKHDAMSNAIAALTVETRELRDVVVSLREAVAEMRGAAKVHDWRTD